MTCGMRTALLVLVLSLRPTSAGEQCVADSLEGTVCTAPLDFVLLVDNSDSLGPFVAATDNFMVQFIEAFELSTDGPMISLIVFNEEAEVLHQLSADKDALIASISTRTAPQGDTYMQAGLVKAKGVLEDSPRRGYATGVTLLLSDGLSSQPDYRQCRFPGVTCSLETLALGVKNADISIFWIGYTLEGGGLGWGTIPRDVICSSPPAEYYADGGDPTSAVNSIGPRLRPLPRPPTAVLCYLISASARRSDRRPLVHPDREDLLRLRRPLRRADRAHARRPRLPRHRRSAQVPHRQPCGRGDLRLSH